MDACFGDAIVFFQRFQSFIKESPPTSSTRKLYAVCSIDYTMDLYGEALDQTTVFKTRPTIFEGPPDAWWRSYVHHPIERFLCRFVTGDVVNISYHWE